MNIDYEAIGRLGLKIASLNPEEFAELLNVLAPMPGVGFTNIGYMIAVRDADDFTYSAELFVREVCKLWGKGY